MKIAVAGNADQQVFVDEDVRFHSPVYEQSSNAPLLGIWANLKGPVRMLMNLSVRYEVPNWERIIREHEAIQRAIEIHDADSAEQMIMEHLDSALERAKRYVEKFEKSI